jgi:hypothetical protein
MLVRRMASWIVIGSLASSSRPRFSVCAPSGSTLTRDAVLVGRTRVTAFLAHIQPHFFLVSRLFMSVCAHPSIARCAVRKSRERRRLSRATVWSW